MSNQKDKLSCFYKRCFTVTPENFTSTAHIKVDNSTKEVWQKLERGNNKYRAFQITFH